LLTVIVNRWESQLRSYLNRKVFVCFVDFFGARQFLEYFFKGATGLYKPVGGAGASFGIILNILHIRDPFFKIKKYLQII